MKLFITMFLMMFIGAYSSVSEASSEKIQVQEAMKKYVKNHTGEKGLLPVTYKGKILQLKLATSKKYPDGFHEGVKNEGKLFTSCADFVEPATGNKYDIDFLVNKVGSQYLVVQPIVHSVNGKKNPYDLSH